MTKFYTSSRVIKNLKLYIDQIDICFFMLNMEINYLLQFQQ